MTQTSTGVTLAAAAAAIFAMGAALSVPAYAADTSVQCVGANSCKGTSECKTAKNDCKGMNSCKGQGWTKAASAEACKAAGGTVAAAAKK